MLFDKLVLFALTCIYHQVHGKLHPGQIGEPPGPMVTPTRGEVWPKPHEAKKFNNYLVIRTNLFRFNRLNETCDILEAAMRRYYRILVEERIAGLRSFVKPNSETTKQQWFTDPNFRGYLNVLHIELNAPCETLPHFDMNEQYTLQINTPDLLGTGKLSSQSVWGILRGLETFVQLVVAKDQSTEMQIHSMTITDYPRFKHRGLMVDTARHFLPVPLLMTIINGMEASKLNVFHWHIVDEQAFPYQSKVFPELSEKGAYHPVTHVYTHDDIKTVIEYCRFRGIRVIPEFDSPGHTRSWGQSHPEILTKCYDYNSLPDGSYGPLDPSNKKTYTFVKKLFTEINKLYPDSYFHIGGDEVGFDCWKSNAAVRKFMAKNKMSQNYTQLEQLYISKIIKMVEDMGSHAMVWQEVFDNGLTLNNKTIIHVWKGMDKDLYRITRAGHLALLSTCWYLDHDGDWKEYYRCDPHKFTFNTHQQNLVIGGESCIWTEYADAGSIVQRIFPRASVMAEKLWSRRDHTFDLNEAESRLEEFRCKLIRRGVSARPVGGASFCPGEYGADWPGLAPAHKFTDNTNKNKEKEYYLRVDYTEMMNSVM